MAKAKTKAQGTSKDRDRELLLTWARQVLADQNATGIDKGRASDVLMRVIGFSGKDDRSSPLGEMLCRLAKDNRAAGWRCPPDSEFVAPVADDEPGGLLSGFPQLHIHAWLQIITETYAIVTFLDAVSWYY